MANVTHAQLRAILKVVLFTPANDAGFWGLPMMLVGDPGMGKTSMAKAEAKALGLLHKVLIGAISDPTDFGGTPSQPLDGSRFARMLLAEWIREVDDWGDRPGVVILDEFTCIPAATQAAMLRLVLERAAGDFTFHKRVRLLGAMNPVEQAAGGQPLAMPTGNRFGHLTVEGASLDDWFDILQGRFYNANPLDALAEEARVLEVWDAEYARALSLAHGFLRRKPEFAQRTPKAGTPEAEGAWTSRRTWEFAARALAGSRIHGLDEDGRDALLASFLGGTTAAAWVAWMRDMDLPEAEDLLDGRVQWVPTSARPDRTQTVADMVANCVLKTADPTVQVARAKAAWTFLGTLSDTPDLSYRAAVALSGNSRLLALPEAFASLKMLREMATILGTGGLSRR